MAGVARGEVGTSATRRPRAACHSRARGPCNSARSSPATSTGSCQTPSQVKGRVEGEDARLNPSGTRRSSPRSAVRSAWNNTMLRIIQNTIDSLPCTSMRQCVDSKVWNTLNFSSADAVHVVVVRLDGRRQREVEAPVG
ncbi:hypothetical protein H310_03095 [Aphanomyces invadans]|uniref:Uncharacterized protein n=1 Tax=Aphanomyces invadans TaxID=157072 RepID=A0A024UKN5_9STRA|nr:hypothetical protein H310_03095 [Aphanomyces invadans]ETW06996.1 hypothetical protein H310_03095 [Aphanomyces invadans]|eukprot:XP_008865071.1 hypothetical protein H310_03095 [Aphanomyces invadans]